MGEEFVNSTLGQASAVPARPQFGERRRDLVNSGQ
jgi:hypothetical protein